MTAAEKDLSAEEGVNQGSADATDESEETAGDVGALAAASSDGRPQGEYDPAPPLDVETDTSRSSRDAVATGQQLEAGEG